MFDVGGSRLFHGSTYDADRDFSRLKNNQQRVFFLMLDGEWHFPKEIKQVGGSKGLTRVRALRESQYGGLVVEKEHCGGGLWRYRLNLESVTPDIVQKYEKWSFSKGKTKEGEWAERCRKRLHAAVNNLSDEQVKLLADFVRNGKWWKFGYHFYKWGQHGHK